MVISIEKLILGLCICLMIGVIISPMAAVSPYGPPPQPPAPSPISPSPPSPSPISPGTSSGGGYYTYTQPSYSSPSPDLVFTMPSSPGDLKLTPEQEVLVSGMVNAGTLNFNTNPNSGTGSGGTAFPGGSLPCSTSTSPGLSQSSVAGQQSIMGGGLKFTDTSGISPLKLNPEAVARGSGGKIIAVFLEKYGNGKIVWNEDESQGLYGGPGEAGIFIRDKISGIVTGTIEHDDGVITQVTKDEYGNQKTTVTTDPKLGITVTKSDDGTTIIEWKGTTEKIDPDGTTTLTLADGTKFTYFRDGSYRVDFNNCYAIVDPTDGSIRWYDLKGNPIPGPLGDEAGGEQPPVAGGDQQQNGNEGGGEQPPVAGGDQQQGDTGNEVTWNTDEGETVPCSFDCGGGGMPNPEDTSGPNNPHIFSSNIGNNYQSLVSGSLNMNPNPEDTSGPNNPHIFSSNTAGPYQSLVSGSSNMQPNPEDTSGPNNPHIVPGGSAGTFQDWSSGGGTGAPLYNPTVQSIISSGPQSANKGSIF
jgi:hypothetical protein